MGPLVPPLGTHLPPSSRPPVPSPHVERAPPLARPPPHLPHSHTSREHARPRAACGTATRLLHHLRRPQDEAEAGAHPAAPQALRAGVGSLSRSLEVAGRGTGLEPKLGPSVVPAPPPLPQARCCRSSHHNRVPGEENGAWPGPPALIPFSRKSELRPCVPLLPHFSPASTGRPRCDRCGGGLRSPCWDQAGLEGWKPLVPSRALLIWGGARKLAP